MKKKLISILLFLLIIVGCDKKSDNENLSSSEIQKPKDSLESVSVEKPEKDIQYNITVEKIDSLDYRHFAIKNATKKPVSVI